MKILKIALITSIVGSQFAEAGGNFKAKAPSPYIPNDWNGINLSTEVIEVRVKNLESIGFNPHSIVNEFLWKYDVRVDLEQVLKVTPSDEGKSINFSILDEISITVPVELADGVANKDRPSPD